MVEEYRIVRRTSPICRPVLGLIRLRYQRIVSDKLQLLPQRAPDNDTAITHPRSRARQPPATSLVVGQLYLRLLSLQNHQASIPSVGMPSTAAIGPISDSDMPPIEIYSQEDSTGRCATATSESEGSPGCANGALPRRPKRQDVTRVVAPTLTPISAR